MVVLIAFLLTLFFHCCSCGSKEDYDEVEMEPPAEKAEPPSLGRSMSDQGPPTAGEQEVLQRSQSDGLISAKNRVFLVNLDDFRSRQLALVGLARPPSVGSVLSDSPTESVTSSCVESPTDSIVFGIPVGTVLATFPGIDQQEEEYDNTLVDDSETSGDETQYTHSIVMPVSEITLSGL